MVTKVVTFLAFLILPIVLKNRKQKTPEIKESKKVKIEEKIKNNLDTIDDINLKLSVLGFLDLIDEDVEEKLPKIQLYYLPALDEMLEDIKVLEDADNSKVKESIKTITKVVDLLSSLVHMEIDKKERKALYNINANIRQLKEDFYTFDMGLKNG